MKEIGTQKLMIRKLSILGQQATPLETQQLGSLRMTGPLLS